jgi:hypothetical protein
LGFGPTSFENLNGTKVLAAHAFITKFKANINFFWIKITDHYIKIFLNIFRPTKFLGLQHH